MAVFQLAVSAGALYRGKFAVLTLVTVLGAACNIALNLLLIPEYGVTGAAVAAFATYTVLAVVGYFISPLPELLGGMVGRLLLTVTLGGGFFAAGEWLRPAGDLAAVAEALALSVGYAACSYLLLMRDPGSESPPPKGGKHSVRTSAA
jgi:O-antigen/teichoic acid export membrane protein